MKIIVDEAGEIIAKASDDYSLIGGHHRLAVAASLGKRVFWRDTGEPVKLDLFQASWKFCSTYSHSRSPNIPTFAHLVNHRAQLDPARGRSDGIAIFPSATSVISTASVFLTAAPGIGLWPLPPTLLRSHNDRGRYPSDPCH